ncbi:MAG: OmcA/MtrC family decaheme c-type cytochrome [Bryobacterales bacterium]|nr:OmcA/MtrC family decaheme c-type cytochrome [Bryobacterales bacterium]
MGADGTSTFKPTEKAFYASPDQINFVRPGLAVTVSKAEIAADGTIRAWVRVADPKNLPLDREGITTPGPIALSFLIGTIPADGTQYTSYITRSRTSGSNTVTQATGESNGTWQKVSDGEYIYTFANKAPETMDRAATHTLGVYGSRNLTEFDMGTSRADTVFNFVPAGGAVTKVRDVVRTSSCNKCHDQLNFHGGNRRSVGLCNLCHTPQTPDAATLNTTDMKVMIHKIHRGASLPSVVAKKPYMIGTRDYSTVVNPSPGQACVVCHESKAVSGATQADHWYTAPSRAACGSCHDNVNFATGQNHPLPQVSDNQCANCHTPIGENDFDVSIQGAHVVPTQSSLLDQIKFTIEKVEDVGPGKNPTVTFTVKDKYNRPVKPSDMTNLRLYMGGPTADITSYVREDALKADGPGDGRYFWTFVAAMPANASGTWQFGIEGYRNTVLLPGTERARTVRDVGQNKVVYASAGGPVIARRTVVSTAKCNQCHYSIGFHGGNRNTVEQCTFCHNPTLTAGTPAESFNFSTMIHRFHAEARYPGNLNNCAQCHVNDSQSLPLALGLSDVRNPQAKINPTPPVTNACQGCHGESAPFWSHAQANINTLGESCAVCHGRNADLAVSKVHAQ